MECKNCGTLVVEEGASYCGNCGVRIDGKKNCKVCGRLNNEQNHYCIFCGTRIDGKLVCADCGVAYDGGYCLSCGKKGIPMVENTATNTVAAGAAIAPVSLPVVAPSPVVAEKCKPSWSLEKICRYAGEGALIFGALLALIFVFFISVVVKQAAGGNEDKITIFYYFKDYYSDFDRMKAVFSYSSVTAWFKDSVNTYGTVTGILGILCSVATLLCVVGFGLVALGQYVVSWVYQKENKSPKWALACIISFFVGVAVFYAFNVSEGGMDGNENLLNGLVDTSVVRSTKLGGGTVTAIVLIAILVVAYMVCLYIPLGREILKKSTLSKLLFSLVGVVLAGVLLAFAQNVFFGLNVKVTIGGQEIGRYAGNSFPMMSLRMMTTLATMGSDAQNYKEITDYLSRVNAYGLLAQLALILLSVCAGFALFGHCTGTEKGKKKATLWASLAFGSSVFVLIFSICAWSRTHEIVASFLELKTLPLSSSIFYETSGQFGAAICCVIFSLLLLVLSAVQTMLEKRKEETLPSQKAAPIKETPAKEYSPSAASLAPIQAYTPPVVTPTKEYAPPVQTYIAPAEPKDFDEDISVGLSLEAPIVGGK